MNIGQVCEDSLLDQRSPHESAEYVSQQCRAPGHDLPVSYSTAHRGDRLGAIVEPRERPFVPALIVVSVALFTSIPLPDWIIVPLVLSRDKAGV
jgi:hypothetical protein